MSDTAVSYVLGHDDQELARLARQANFIDPITRQFFREAGIAPGMRVLDIGSGAGHTAMVVAELVGASGEVVGADRAERAISMATRNAQVRALSNITFQLGDPIEMVFERPFDAVVGRYVLVFNQDEPGTLRALAKHLVPGGLVAFHEPTMLVARSIPTVALYERCCHWRVEGFRAGGVTLDTAQRLHGIFLNAGLPAPATRMQVCIGGATQVAGYLETLVDMIRTLLSTIERHGIATAAEIDIDTLLDRLHRDILASGSTILGRADIAAWCRV